LYAPLLIWLSGPLVRILGTGARVLPQHEWEDRERLIYRRLHGAPIRVDGNGTLVLPYLAGETLAAVLQRPDHQPAIRKSAIELAVVALAELHAHGLTHADAMAENVMVDLAAGAAHWFDFENAHDSTRSMAWRRADDLRALLATCLLRSPPADLAEIAQLIVDVNGDDSVTALLLATFASALRSPLAFHHGNAP
jgi:hypothetical protein